MEAAQASRDRGAIYLYLTAVFELVEWWAKEGKAVKRAHRALHLRGHSSVREPEPFATVIFARQIATRSMSERGASGHGCCATLRNTKTWMSCWGISSSTGVASMNVRRGLLVASGDNHSRFDPFGPRVGAFQAPLITSVRRPVWRRPIAQNRSCKRIASAPWLMGQPCAAAAEAGCLTRSSCSGISRELLQTSEEESHG